MYNIDCCQRGNIACCSNNEKKSWGSLCIIVYSFTTLELHELLQPALSNLPPVKFHALAHLRAVILKGIGANRWNSITWDSGSAAITSYRVLADVTL